MNRLIVTGGSGFIGTNYIMKQYKKYDRILNIDIKPPKLNKHKKYYKKCNILDKKYLGNTIRDFKPDIILHLAAETDVNGKTLEYYRENVEGVSNLLEAVKISDSVKRLIITSTQYVHQRNGLPKSGTDFYPYTVYGKSKVETEKLTRKYDPDVCWTIIRPTNIWGPYSEVYAENLWKVMNKGLYFHPGKQKVIRSYGYVENVVDQIENLIHKSGKEVNKKVFYVGDKPLKLYDFVNKFSLAITGEKVKVLPRFLLRSLALFGSLLKYFNIPFPLHIERYKNMILDNPAPMEKTFKLLGEPKINIERGIKQSANWYLNNYQKIQ